MMALVAACVAVGLSASTALAAPEPAPPRCGLTYDAARHALVLAHEGAEVAIDTRVEPDGLHVLVDFARPVEVCLGPSLALAAGFARWRQDGRRLLIVFAAPYELTVVDDPTRQEARLINAALGDAPAPVALAPQAESPAAVATAPAPVLPAPPAAPSPDAATAVAIAPEPPAPAAVPAIPVAIAGRRPDAPFTPIATAPEPSRPVAPPLPSLPVLPPASAEDAPPVHLPPLRVEAPPASVLPVAIAAPSPPIAALAAARPAFTVAPRIGLGGYAETYLPGDVAVQAGGVALPGVRLDGHADLPWGPAWVQGPWDGALQLEVASIAFRDTLLPLSTHTRQALRAELAATRRFTSGDWRLDAGLGYLLRTETTLHSAVTADPSYAFAASRWLHGPSVALGGAWAPERATGQPWLDGWRLRLDTACQPVVFSRLDAGVPPLPWLVGTSVAVALERRLADWTLSVGYQRRGLNGAAYDETFQGPFLSVR